MNIAQTNQYALRFVELEQWKDWDDCLYRGVKFTPPGGSAFVFAASKESASPFRLFSPVSPSESRSTRANPLIPPTDAARPAAFHSYRTIAGKTYELWSIARAFPEAIIGSRSFVVLLPHHAWHRNLKRYCPGAFSVITMTLDRGDQLDPRTGGRDNGEEWQQNVIIDVREAIQKELDLARDWNEINAVLQARMDDFMKVHRNLLKGKHVLDPELLLLISNWIVESFAADTYDNTIAYMGLNDNIDSENGHLSRLSGDEGSSSKRGRRRSREAPHGATDPYVDREDVTPFPEKEYPPSSDRSVPVHNRREEHVNDDWPDWSGGYDDESIMSRTERLEKRLEQQCN
jgi:hypothetical protein